MTKQETGGVAVVDARQPTGKLKLLGGSDEDDFNRHLVVNTALALPRSTSPEAAAVTKSSLRSLKPEDAIEGLLAAQLLAAHDASLELFRRAWSPGQTPERMEKYINLANKTARTVAVLTDSLDRHRSRSVQPVTKNVTVTGGQAVVADTIFGGDLKGRD
jgi:hypothetical protein